MLGQFKNLPELLDHFKDKKTCLEFLEQMRWKGNITCPHCGHDKVYRLKEGFKCANNECCKKFSVIVGSIFENTKVPLRSWFAAIFMCLTHKKGVSSLQLSRDIGVTQKTAWFMLHRIRKLLTEIAPEKIEDVVEVDETFVGGKNKNRHYDKKVKNSQGRSFKDKTPVLGILQRGGRIICKVVPDTKAATIQPLLREIIKPGSTVYSDEWWAYQGLSNAYHHEIVDHGRGQYKNGDACTNSIEGFWGIFKRGIIGIYNWVSRKHLQNYCEEFVFRYNHRNLTNLEKFNTAISNYALIRLPYKQLIS